MKIGVVFEKVGIGCLIFCENRVKNLVLEKMLKNISKKGYKKWVDPLKKCLH